ncbi:Highly reducing polyketide synthase, partial [Lachnellula occidentalis]
MTINPEPEFAVPSNDRGSPKGVHHEAVQEPLAVIGVGLRLPGGIHTTEDLWDLLAEKRSTRCKVPTDRFNISAFYSKSGRPGALRSEYAHFLAESDNLRHLDTNMFSIPKKEADVLDPQEKMLLEVVYECMQNAGQTNWRGESIGCFVGVFGEDWSDLYAKDVQAGGIPGPHRICGQHDFALSNGVSYMFDLKGPSATVKSACSSSLIALHNAIRAIQAGDCKSAIIASTSLILTPTATASMWPALSPDGICKSFDASANGYVRGEAINAIYIKPLSDALKDGDPIRSIIRGTAVNFDGKMPGGITMPSSEMQEAVMRKAYEGAGLNPQETAFVEAHGTGTPVGDPIEAKAIERVFGSDQVLYLGSIKPNVGHAEGASGINSMLKCILALERSAIPPNIHFSTPNPRIEFEKANMVVPVETMPWPEQRLQRASVNSFGIGGANAHVILESLACFQNTATLRPSSPTTICHGLKMGNLDPCRTPSSTELSSVSDRSYRGQNESDGKPTLFVLSAASKESLAASILEHQRYMKAHLSELQHLSYTLCRRREFHKFRTFCVKNGDAMDFTVPRKQNNLSQITMVFTGQGAQWAEMAKELINDYETFETDIDALSHVLSGLENPPDWNIKEELLKLSKMSRLNSAEYAQPITTAVQIALVNLLRSWNIHPSAVVGHSSGEIAAAYAAYAISAEEA